MKIGILTLTLHTNYGGILQAYALQTVLERMGHEVMVFNRPFVPLKTRWCEVFKRIIKKSIGKDVVIFKELKYNREAPYINQCVWEFRKKYIHERTIDSLYEIRENDVDCIVVGSDQVWRPVYFESQWNTGIENAYLWFTKDWAIRRIVYAASFGVDVWEMPESKIQKCWDAIKRIDVVSVRESNGVDMVRQKFKIDASLVLDPTLLLTVENYKELIKKDKTPISPGNMLVYILDAKKQKKDYLNKLLEDGKYTPFTVNNTLVSETAQLEERKLPSVESWLRGFYDADYIVTDSFHACVFSIIFGKPFTVFANDSRGLSRITSLFETLKINANEFNITNSSNVMKVFSVDNLAGNRLTQMRNFSMEFLKNSLE